MYYLYPGSISNAFHETVIWLFTWQLFLSFLVHAIQNIVSFKIFRHLVWLKFKYFSLPYNITNTQLGFAYGLAGIEFGGAHATLASELFLSYYFTLMFFISTILEDLILTIQEMDKQLDGNTNKNEILQSYFREIMFIHYWVIE